LAQAVLTAFASEWDLVGVRKGNPPARGPLARFQWSINKAGWFGPSVRAILAVFTAGWDLEVVGKGNSPNY